MCNSYFFLRWVLRKHVSAFSNHHLELVHGKVESWYDIVLRYCMMDRNVRERYNDPTSFLLLKMRRYRDPWLPRHEFLVAEVLPKGASTLMYFRLERLWPGRTRDGITCCDHQAEPLSRSDISSTASTSVGSPSISHKSEPLPKKDMEAGAWVSILRGWPKGRRRSAKEQAATDSAGIDKNSTKRRKQRSAIMIEEVTFKNTTLYDVMIVSFTMRVNSPIYDVFKHQCYWFTNLILRVLVECDPDSQQTFLDHTAEAQVWKEEEMCYDPSDGAKCYGFPIHEAKREAVEELTRFILSIAFSPLSGLADLATDYGGLA